MLSILPWVGPGGLLSNIKTQGIGIDCYIIHVLYSALQVLWMTQGYSLTTQNQLWETRLSQYDNE